MRFFSLISMGLVLIALSQLALAVEVKSLSVGNGERLLILAPHPDDESLSAGGLAQRVLEKGGSVRSVVVTSGDAYVEAVIQQTGKHHPSTSDYLDFGEQRLDESRQAAQVLGKNFIHLDLLGFSDGSLYSALVWHWRRNSPMRSYFTGFDHVPYRDAEDWGAAQDGQDLLNELVAILRDTRPTMIAFPDVMEDDSDHSALGMFALLAVHDWLSQANMLQTAPRLLAYLIHWPHWPTGSDWGIAQDWRDQPMQMPDNLPLRGHSRACLTLNNTEIGLKRDALAQYKTQQRIMPDFLASFVRNSECFTLLKPNNTNAIESVIEHWQQARKVFSSHPLSRKNI